MDPTTLIAMTALLLVIGAGAGLLAGLLGVGGGIVLVPAFFYAFSALGFESPDLMRICVATSLATIIVTSLRSLQTHAKRGAVDWDVLRGWAPGIAVGSLLGMLTASSLSSTALQAVFGALALVVGLYLALGRGDWRVADAMPGPWGRAAMSPLVGFLSVLVGIGGGSLGVPIMTLHAMPIHRAVATAAGFGVVIAVPSVIGFLLAPVGAPRPPLQIGSVNLAAFALIIAMTLITAPIGARLAHSMNPVPLRRVFAVFLIAVAINMGVEALS